jgi:hypothetical protein
MPAHSTHRLQPLDVGLFGPLSTAYSKQVNNLMHKSLGLVSMTKRLFYPLFRDAWIEAFTEKNILRAFEKTGIWPHNPNIVLDKIRKPEPPKTPIKDYKIVLKTPRTPRAIRCAHLAYRQNPEISILDKIFQANIDLAAQVAIHRHIISGLKEAIRIEKKKRQRGKKLNLLGEEDHRPQFFSPGRIQAARLYQDAEEAIRC